MPSGVAIRVARKSQDTYDGVFNVRLTAIPHQRLIGGSSVRGACRLEFFFGGSDGLHRSFHNQLQIRFIGTALERCLSPNANHVRAFVIVRARHHHITKLFELRTNPFDLGILQTHQIDCDQRDAIPSVTEHNAAHHQRVVDTRGPTAGTVSGDPHRLVWFHFRSDLGLRKPGKQRHVGGENRMG